MGRKFNVGDKVQLSTKTGPVLSVKENVDDPYVLCQWWDEKTQSFKIETFAEEQLTAVE